MKKKKNQLKVHNWLISCFRGPVGIETASEYRIPNPYKVVKFERDRPVVLGHIKNSHPVGDALSEAGIRLALLSQQRSST